MGETRRPTSEVALVGAGNIARALAEGWTRADPATARAILVCDRGSGRAARLADELGVSNVATAEAAAAAAVVVLCVKPADAPAALLELGPMLAPAEGKTVVSVVGGLTFDALGAALPGEVGLVRAMPNLAVRVPFAGTVCYAAAPSTTAAQREQALEWLGLAATAIELDRAAFDAATVVTSCAPAVVAYVSEVVETVGTEAGLEPETAAALTAGMVAGVGALLQEPDLTAAELRRRVTSPGGAVAPGIQLYERAGLRRTLENGFARMLERLEELSAVQVDEQAIRSTAR